MVPGHPKSKVMVLVESLLVVSYLTSIVSNIVSLAVFEISSPSLSFGVTVDADWLV